MKKVKISITCDEGHVAEFLRELAIQFEELGEFISFTTYHGKADVKIQKQEELI